MSMIGNSHSEARKKIFAALNDELLLSQLLNSNFEQLLQRLGPPLFTVIALAVLYGLLFESENEGNRVMRPGLLFCLIVYIVALLVSIASHVLRRKTLQGELQQAISSLLFHYDLQCNNLMESTEDKSDSLPSPLMDDQYVKLMSGHSHLSIVNVFRNSCWQKIPALLLVEGDLIALMGGDIAPCKVQHLKDEHSLAASSKKSEVKWSLGSMVLVGETIPVDIINMHADGGDEFGDGLSSKCRNLRFETTASQVSSAPSVLAPSTSPTGSSTTAQLRNRVITPDSLEILKFSGNMRCFLVLDIPAVDVLKSLMQQSQVKKEGSFFSNLRRQTEHLLAYVALASIAVCGVIIVIKRIFGFVFFANIVWSVLIPLVSILIVFAPPNLLLLENIIETLGTAMLLAVRWMLMSTKNSSKQKMDFDADEDFENELNDKHTEGKIGKNSFAKEKQSNVSNEQDEGWKVGPFHFTPKSDNNGWLKSTFRSNPVRLVGHSHSIASYYGQLLRRRWLVCKNDIKSNGASMIHSLFSLPFESSNFLEELGSISMVCFIDDDIICENNACCEEVLLMGEENDEIPGLSTPKYGVAKRTTEGLAKSIRDNNANHAKCLVMDLHSGTVENGKRFENPLWWQQLPSLKPLGLACLMNHAGSTELGTSPPSDSYQRLADLPSSKTIDNAGQIKHSLVQYVRRNLPMPFLKDLAEEVGFQESDSSNFTKLFEINVLSPKLDQEYLSQESHQMSLEESKRRGFLMPKLRSSLCKDVRGGFQLIGVGDPALVLSYCKEYWDGNTRTITPLSQADREEILQFYERWRLEDFEVLAFAYTPVPDSTHLESFIRHSYVDPTAPPPVTTTTLNAASLAAISHGKGSGHAMHNNNSHSHYDSHHHHQSHHHMSRENSPWGPKPLYFVDLTTDVGDLKSGANINSANSEMPDLSSGVPDGGGKNNSSTVQPFSQHSIAYSKDTMNDSSDPANGDDYTGDQPNVNHAETDGEGVDSKNPMTLPGNQLKEKFSHRMSASAPIDQEDDMINDGDGDGDGDAEDGPDDLNTAAVMNDHDEGYNDGEHNDDGPDTEHPSEHVLLRDGFDASASSKRLKRNSFEAISDGESEMMDKPVRHEEEDDAWMMSYDNTMIRAITEPAGLRQTIAALEQAHGKFEEDDTEVERLKKPHQRSINPLTDEKSNDYYEGDVIDEYENEYSGMEFRRIATEPAVVSSGILTKSLSLGKALDVYEQHGSRRRATTTSDSPAGLARLATSPSLPSPRSSSEKLRSQRTLAGLTIVKSVSIDGLTMARDREMCDVLIDEEERESITFGGRHLGSSSKRRKSKRDGLDGTQIDERERKLEEDDDDGQQVPESEKISRNSQNTSKGARRSRGNSNSSKHGVASIANFDAAIGAGIQNRNIFDPTILKKMGNKRGVRAVNRLHAKGMDALSELHLRQVKRLTYRSLWNITRQQIFLGMVASSVPVREDVPILKEALDAAGVRFIYFSPRNMKRSKPIAEKIGIPFDWNCAISLRDLGDANVIDPHRHISSYADWDVLARMPHGIEAIKRHIREVDNVPLLVSLFTDSTPHTIRQMLEIFREYGETVLAIGSGYRCYHTDIFNASNIASSIATLPGVVPSIATKEHELFSRFPVHDGRSLCKSDIEFAFRLVGLGTFNLVQCDEANGTNNEADLSKLVQLIRAGRQILENQYQIFGFVVTVLVSLALTIIILHFIPLSTSPFLPLPMLLVYLLLYVPLLAIALLFVRNADDLLRNTPRKRLFVMKVADRDRFAWYLFLRASSVAASVYTTGYFATASVFRSAQYHPHHHSYPQSGDSDSSSMIGSLGDYHWLFRDAGSDRSGWLRDVKGYWLVQDLVMNAVLMSIFVQCWTMQSRGYSVLANKNTKWDGKLFLLGIMAVIALVQVGIMTYRALLRSCYNDVNYSSVWLLSGMSCQVSQATDSHFAAYSELHWTCWVAIFVLTPISNLLVAEYVNQQDLKLRTRHLQFLRLEFDTRLGMHSPR